MRSGLRSHSLINQPNIRQVCWAQRAEMDTEVVACDKEGLVMADLRKQHKNSLRRGIYNGTLGLSLQSQLQRKEWVVQNWRQEASQTQSGLESQRTCSNIEKHTQAPHVKRLSLRQKSRNLLWPHSLLLQIRLRKLQFIKLQGIKR